MPLGIQRSSILYGIGKKRASVHRYTWIRWGVGLIFTVAIALLPLTNTLRFDLWGGNHYYLGERVDLVSGAKAFAFPFLAVNIAIIVASRLVGRYLCGFVCPVGSLARLGEWIGWRKRNGHHGVAWGRAALLLLALLLGSITFSFWVDWRVFRDGSMLARSIAGGALAAVVGGFFALVSGLGLRFCRELCPSGIYFALLGPKTSSGIAFAHPENCTDCHACENSCPMDLMPRALAGEPSRGGLGLYPDGLSNHANCVRCGDCVIACEGTTARDGVATPLAFAWLKDAAAPGAANHGAPSEPRARDSA